MPPMGPALDLVSDSDEAGSSARFSFSSESLLDESNFITICPDPLPSLSPRNTADFEFLSAGTLTRMITADELMSEGKLLPSHEQIYHGGAKPDKERLVGIECTRKKKEEEESVMTWFIDEDPSPRPPKCTVLWKELLKLRRQRPSVLSPSISSPSSSLSRISAAGGAEIRGEEEENGAIKKSSEKSNKRVKERSRSIGIRIRPVLTVPICTKSVAALPPLFSFRKRMYGSLNEEVERKHDPDNMERL